MRALFRADASADIGGGHIVRCLALADALSQMGAETGFATIPSSLEAVPALKHSSHEIFVLDHMELTELAALSPLWTEGCDLLVVDQYGLDAAFETACRHWARTIMAIDDLAERRHDCDILLDSLAGRTRDDYKDLVPAACQMLLGPKHALLRPQFSAARPAALASRRDRSDSRTLFISFGSVDLFNMTGRVLTRLGERDGQFGDVHVALGGGSPNVGEVRQQAANMPMSVSVHVDSPDMAGLMAMADVAIGAAGSMSWERCCLGLPTVAIAVADNQIPIAGFLENAGAAIIVQDAGCDVAEEIAVQVEALLSDASRQSGMSEAAAAICDGGGLARVLDAVIPLATVH